IKTNKNNEAILGKSEGIFQGKTLQEVSAHTAELGWRQMHRGEMNPKPLDHDMVLLSPKAVEHLGKGSSYLIRKFFGKNSLNEILYDNP
ncbi:hypothetical protein M3M33_14850, partial [Loigolactobacillus coryniformis]|uniref:hypothetical protein n=1 Tax=Loigolactobacillus coryniformis TaxID=1610 RepID=UPI00201A5B05